MSEDHKSLSGNSKIAVELSARKRSLAAALVEVKNRQADRDDVVVDMKEAEQARLELLAEDVRPLFNELPTENDQFEFALTSGKPPRLWIDMTTQVAMGHDKRVYRLIKTTRAGRVVLAESSNMKLIGDAIGAYVAERVLERERIIEGEWQSLRLVEDEAVDAKRSEQRARRQNLLWFVVGFAVSALSIYGWVRYGAPPAL